MHRLFFAVFAAGLLLASPLAAAEPAEFDPIEKVNRGIFRFNDTLDVWLLEPVATGWHRVAPDPVERAVSRFFGNLRFPIVLVNDLLQGKIVAGASDVGRFVVNTTAGMAGFLDVATMLGLEQHEEDFGQTLGWWGVPPGPYLVLPLLGPSTIRDTGGLAVDAALFVPVWFVEWYVTGGARVVDAVNTRAQYLDEVRKNKEQAFDYYNFVRNAYLQRRRRLVSDSKEVPVEEQEELYDGTATR